MAPLMVHFLISLMLVVSAVSSTAQLKTLRPADIVESGIDQFPWTGQTCVTVN